MSNTRIFVMLFCLLAAGAGVFSEDSPEATLQHGLYFSDLYNWTAARPYLTQAKQLFEASGDQRNALYARLAAIRAGAEPVPLPELSYQLAQELETRCEEYLTEDADVLLVGFGIVSRVLRSTVDQLRAQGLKAGLFRPITLWPYPSRELCQAAQQVKSVMVVELNTGMMVEDVKLALDGKVPVEFYGRAGGNVPAAEEITAQVFSRMSALV